MRILLDTVAFWWLATQSEELSQNAIDVFENRGNDIYLSPTSIWELIVKHQLGNLPVSSPIESVINDLRKIRLIRTLPMFESVPYRLYSLPSIHRDPFDRILICQALQAGLTILTPDKQIQAYPVPTLW